MEQRTYIAAVAALLALVVPVAVWAADTGEQWEVSTTMNIPGMPAGMGGQKSRVCTDKNESPGPGRSDCKVTNVRRSGLTESMTVTCPDGNMTVEMTYNAARTEYKGKVTIDAGKKDDELTMNLAGRKVGTCDPVAERAKMEAENRRLQAQGKAQTAEMNRQLAEQQKKAAAATAAATAKVTDSCNEAVSEMNVGKFPREFCLSARDQKAVPCSDKGYRDSMRDRPGYAACTTKKTEFCQRLQTPAGYWRAAPYVGITEDEEDQSKSKGAKAEGDFCGFDNSKLIVAVCARWAKEQSPLDFAWYCPSEAAKLGAGACAKAQETESYFYLGRYCAEGKALYSKNCAGRDFTSVYQGKNPKMYRMCSQLALAQDDARAQQRTRAQPAPTSPSATSIGSPAPAEKKKGGVDAVSEGVQQGINKLKGLFGR